VERRLAAILSVDVAECSHLMGVGAEVTVAVLEAYRRKPIEPKIALHSWRIVKTRGDGCIEACDCYPVL
jgi:hypothetical protein